MKLTPLDVRKADFRRSLRGFDVDDVRVFLDVVAGEYEKLLQENGVLGERVRQLTERLGEFHGLEKTLQSSIVTAERISAESQERSRREADLVVEDARIRGERILEDARERLRILSRDIQELRTQKDLFLQRFQSVLAAQAELLRMHTEDLGRVDEMDARASNLIAGAPGPRTLAAGPGAPPEPGAAEGAPAASAAGAGAAAGEDVSSDAPALCPAVGESAGLFPEDLPLPGVDPRASDDGFEDEDERATAVAQGAPRRRVAREAEGEGFFRRRGRLRSFFSGEAEEGERR